MRIALFSLVLATLLSSCTAPTNKTPAAPEPTPATVVDVAPPEAMAPEAPTTPETTPTDATPVAPAPDATPAPEVLPEPEAPVAQ